eukprot:5774771-Pyramimonas_sp.AAC.1
MTLPLRAGGQRASTLVAASKHEAGKARTERIRKGNLKTEQRGQRDFVKEYDERLRQLAGANEEMLEADLTRKQDMVRVIT